MDISFLKEQAEGILEGDRDNYDGADGARTILELCTYIEELELQLKAVTE